MRRQLRTTVPLVLVLLSLLAIGAAPALAAPPYVAEECLTPLLPTTQQAPSITRWSEVRETEIAVFEDDRNGNWDIYVRDLWSPWEQQLTTAIADQRHPAASGSWVAFEDARNVDWEIYLVNLSTGVETRLTTNGAAQLDPAVSGDWMSTGTRVAWEDERNGNWDIYLYDVGTATTMRVTANAADQVDPAVDGTRVVWADRRNGNWDIYLYDTVKKTTARLTTNGADQKAPAISGTMVVYQDRRNGNWDIYGYDLATKKERRVTRNAADQTLPALSPRRESGPMVPGWRIVYQDARNGAADIYLSDIPAGGEFRLTDDGADQLAPAIYGPHVAWTDLRDTSLVASPRDVYRGLLSVPSLDAAVDPELIPYNGATSIGGWLDSWAGPVGAARIWRYLRVGVDDQPTTAATLTATDGSYLMSLSSLKQTTRYRMVYRGDATHLPAVSDVVTLNVKAWLSTPTIPKEFSYHKTVTVSCLLRPRHRAGSYPVKFQFYRFMLAPGATSWDWVLAKTVNGKAADYSTYTKCSARVTLPPPLNTAPTEKWRVYAVHRDASHAASQSAYRAFTVNSLYYPLPL